MRTLTRQELTAALAARQLLLERRRLRPADAIRLLTPLQAQHPPAPFLALAARLDGFTRVRLEAAICARGVVKATIMRLTLHVAAADEYPAYAQVARQARMRNWRSTYAHLDEAQVAAELGAWLAEPRTNDEIRERVVRYEGVTADAWTPVIFARTLLPLVQLPPAGFWADRRRPRFVVDPRPLPEPVAAATLVLSRYLAAFGPASRRDAAAWAGVAQRDFAEAWARLPTVSYRDENGSELLDLPGLPLPPASTPLPVRLLANWDQPLLAHADRERIVPAELLPLKLTLSGDPTVTVDGRVAASWQLRREGGAVQLTVTPHVEIRRSARAAIRAEAERTARFCEPDAGSFEIRGV
ncbi:MAG TPA: crosslink repair DNA glycosylase YcaQ family protein [Solirubrobacteraceae bacterium]|nr:crosslink repair DNA glycosylase YcaQ family protein [Solirubrobacteraceae bacterium]